MSFMETHVVADAKIGEAEIAPMVNQPLNLGDTPKGRQAMCKMRQKLRTFCRSRFRVQDLRPVQEAVRLTFATLTLDGLRNG
jgi:hypothetical protein